MPHSISAENSPPQLEDATGLGEASQDGNDADQDLKMADAEGEDQSNPETNIKPEVKLEDLFADVDSDDEFSSSKKEAVEAPSSPQGPLSPV